MQKFQDTFETRKRSFTSAFSVCMTVPIKQFKWRTFRLINAVIISDLIDKGNWFYNVSGSDSNILFKVAHMSDILVLIALPAMCF